MTKNVTEHHLREIFGSFGEIQNLDLPMNEACEYPLCPFTEPPYLTSISVMTNRGTAYIHYNDPADAEAAIAHMHEAQLDGALLNVSIVLPRRAFSRSPPAQTTRGNYGRLGHRRASRPSPYLRRPSPQRRYASARPVERHDLYRPRSLSRSRSPRRSPSYSSRSGSGSPPPRRRRPVRAHSPRRRRRRSPSYSSYGYSSRSDRSRSPSRNLSRSRSRSRYSARRR